MSGHVFVVETETHEDLMGQTHWTGLYRCSCGGMRVNDRDYPTEAQAIRAAETEARYVHVHMEA